MHPNHTAAELGRLWATALHAGLLKGANFTRDAFLRCIIWDWVFFVFFALFLRSGHGLELVGCHTNVPHTMTSLPPSFFLFPDSLENRDLVVLALNYSMISICGDFGAFLVHARRESDSTA